MNISTDKEIGISGKKFTFSDHASPYLSPLHGLSEPSEEFQEDYIPELDIDPLSHKLHQQLGNYPIDYYQKQNPYIDQLEEGYELIGPNVQNDLKIEDDQNKEAEEHIKELRQNNQGLEPGNITSLIIFLVSNDQLSEAQLRGFSLYFCGQSQNLKTIFEILVDKFKKLKKTKEQMTKYCMRKAFRFISEYKNNLKKKGIIKNQTQACISKINYQIPFKKNSQQKTMNSQFLKQTFSRDEFVVGYKQFLKQIHQLIDQDNTLKINTFAESIQKALVSKQFDKIRKWNRLPWTAKILQKTQKLAMSLLEYATYQEKQEFQNHPDESISN